MTSIIFKLQTIEELEERSALSYILKALLPLTARRRYFSNRYIITINTFKRKDNQEQKIIWHCIVL